MTGRWGKAGQRLTDERIRQRDGQAFARRVARESRERDARELWLAGLLRPYRITQALDLRGLYGPEVDLACGAREPDVDMWEAGTLYPTWEQVTRLAELTRFPVGFFAEARTRWIPIGWTSLDIHYPGEPEPPPVLSFTRDAIDATLHREGGGAR